MRSNSIFFVISWKKTVNIQKTDHEFGSHFENRTEYNTIIINTLLYLRIIYWFEFFRESFISFINIIKMINNALNECILHILSWTSLYTYSMILFTQTEIGEKNIFENIINVVSMMPFVKTISSNINNIINITGNHFILFTVFKMFFCQV